MGFDEIKAARRAMELVPDASPPPSSLGPDSTNVEPVVVAVDGEPNADRVRQEVRMIVRSPTTTSEPEFQGVDDEVPEGALAFHMVELREGETIVSASHLADVERVSDERHKMLRDFGETIADLQKERVQLRADLADADKDAKRWQAFVKTADLCTEGPSALYGGYWYSGELVGEPYETRDTVPTPNDYGDRLILDASRPK